MLLGLDKENCTKPPSSGSNYRFNDKRCFHPNVKYILNFRQFFYIFMDSCLNFLQTLKDTKEYIYENFSKQIEITKLSFF